MGKPEQQCPAKTTTKQLIVNLLLQLNFSIFFFDFFSCFKSFWLSIRLEIEIEKKREENLQAIVDREPQMKLRQAEKKRERK